MRGEAGWNRQRRHSVSIFFLTLCLTGWFMVLFISISFRSLAQVTPSVSAAFPLDTGPDAKEPLPEKGKRLLNVRTLLRPSYGVEATSRELSFGMPQICTSDIAARVRPRELPPW